MQGRKIGRFLVLAKLGQGGMATVWKARDELLGRDVALKILDAKIGESARVRRRFLHEAQTVASLDHPGAVAVFDSGESEGTIYIAMRFVDGETLSERLGRRLLPIDEAVRIVIAVADVLAHAHGRGVIHRDVTSRNVMIERDGRVFVLDFGLALANWETRVTSTGATLGTVPYMAPEVLLGREADPRTDLYGLGIVLYEALTGAYPFRGELPAATTYAALHGDPIPPRERRTDIPDSLERIVLRAIAREAEARYQSAAELVAALRGVEPTPEAEARPASRRADEEAVTEPWPTSPERSNPLYLAILPFEIQRARHDQQDELDFVASRLLGALERAVGHQAGIHVVEAPAVLEPGQDLASLARSLGANAYVRGGLAKVGTQLRVSYSIHALWDGRPLASADLDGSELQSFQLEDRVVASVLGQLGLQPMESSLTPASRPPDPAAKERFQQALGYLKRYDNEASVDGAIRLLEGLIVTEGSVAATHAALARAFIHKLEHTGQRMWEHKAAAACDQAQRIDPEAPEVHHALGELFHATGRGDSALREFEKATLLRPEFVESWIGILRVHDRAGRNVQAEEAEQRVMRWGAKDWRVHSHLGIFHFRRGHFERALEHWRRVVELAPDNARGRFNLGSALYRLDRFEEAVEAYRSSIEIQPNPLAYTNLGTALYYLERHTEAVAAFRKATELSPLDPICWGNLGNAYRWIPGHERESSDALGRAVAIMRERLDRNPNDPDAWARLAGWLANRGRVEEARDAIGRALELAPEDAPCLVRAGHVYFQLGQREEALHSFQQALQRGYGVGELERSAELAPLREDPDFQRILKQSSANRATFNLS